MAYEVLIDENGQPYEDNEQPLVVNLQDKTVTPSSVEQIVTADEGYSGLGKVTIGKSEGYTLKQVQGLVNPSMPYDEEALIDITDDMFPSNTTISTYQYNGRKNIRSINTNKLTGTMGNYAFQNCSGIEEVNLPNITTLGTYAFQYCSRLKKATFGNITRIPDYAFSSCPLEQLNNLENITYLGTSALSGTHLGDVNMPNLTTISGGYVFSSSKITSFKAEKLTTIYYAAFQSASNLTKLDLPNVTTVSGGSNLCERCTNLVEVNMPSLKSTGSGGCFKYCTSLININLENVTYINTYDFQYSGVQYAYFPLAKTVAQQSFQQSALKYIQLPSATSISANAFLSAGVSGETTVFDFRGCSSVPTLNNANAFNTNGSKKIVVPDELYDTWKTSTNWSSTSYSIVTSIIKASDYEATL